MRDPLRGVSVRFKLPLAFLGVCLLAFGVGGYLVSTSARGALEGEILSHLKVRSRFHATMLEGELRALQRRAHDFASDGFIRTHFGQLEGARSRLREHLRANKLPLEPAFRNLALVGRERREVFLAEPSGDEWAREVPERVHAQRDWFSGSLATDERGRAPTLVIATPVASLAGDRVLGSLVVQIDVATWIERALASSARSPKPGVAEKIEPELTLRVKDRGGNTLEIPPSWVAGREDIHAGPLRVSPSAPEPPAANIGMGGVLSQHFPISLNGWSLESELRRSDALAAVSGLQARFLFVGLILATVTCLVLLLPMRFLARPIRQLHDAALRIRKGDFGARVPVESSDEIGELSHSFNLMAAAVEQQTEELRAAAASLEQGKNELAIERDRLRAVIHSMRDALIVIDADGKPEVWNAAAEPLVSSVVGGQPDLDAHRMCTHRNGAAADSNGAASACRACLFDPGAPPRSCLIDSGSLSFEVQSTRLGSNAGGRAGRVLVARDITERVDRDEQEIHQERLAVLGEVAAVMAHELNNPLAAIRMYTQMLASKLDSASPLHEDVSVIERNIQTCSHTIRELLDYATGATPEVGPVDVHACLRDVTGFLRAFRERRDRELVLDLHAEHALVVGDEVQLRQVFVNLVLNALQAGGEGPVHLTTSLEGDHLIIDVSDSGPGIPPEIGDSVFRPFFTTKARGRGTGLGLSTARRITEIQGGGLELKDGRAGHTTFRVRLLRDVS